MPTIVDLPVELLVDVLLPILPNRDLVSLASTNREFARLCDDDTFWKRKCDKDFNFDGANTARKTGWKFIYKGLTRPKTYVWGSANNGRLGLGRTHKSTQGGVPYPVHLKFPSKTIVNIVAGGWSFHALDSGGQLFVCGQMDGEGFTRRVGFSSEHEEAETPCLVRLPVPIKSLSCGRKHTLALDAQGQVWNFLSWGRPFRLDTPLFSASQGSIVVQIESGWMFCSALTDSGDVYVWWPFSNPIHQLYAERTREMNQDSAMAATLSSDSTIPAVTWDLPYNPVKLPGLPNLPGLEQNKAGTDYAEKDSPLKLVKIAGMDNVLIGLTNKGHVLKFGGLSNEGNMRASRWEYLPFFTELEKVNSHSTFNQSQQIPGEEQKLHPPSELRITHITAHFEHFVAYSTGSESIVLIGTNDISHDEPADILTELQYKSIISVVLGDYHFAALTADGNLYTWGRFSSGALGLGDPSKLALGAPGGYKTQDQLDRVLGGRRVEVPEVDVPSPVRFDHGEKSRKDKFCFAVAAAGWHTAALVLDPDEEEEKDDSNVLEEEEEPAEEPISYMPLHPIGHIPLLRQARGHAPFRVGFAGRGAAPRGRGMGQGQ